MHEEENLLTVSELTKRYAVTVLDRCSMEIRRGEIHALLGANGAGKSTLCKIVSGLIPATSGSMVLEDQSYTPTSKHDAESAGIQIVQQELELISTLSVAENLSLGHFPSRAGIIRQQAMHTRARKALDRFGLNELQTDTKVGSLGVGRQQMVEIAKALDRDCKLLILDEPTAALSGAETETLFQWLRRLRSEGVGILYISHRLEEVSQLADRVTILRDGRYVCTRSASEMTTSEMVDLMSGKEKGADTDSHEHRSHATSKPAMSVHHLAIGFVRDVSFTVHRGERLGIAGLIGSGRTELLRAIFGADQSESGHVCLGNSTTQHRFRHPAEAVAAGMAMVTEDRKQNGLLLPQSIRLNTTLNSLGRMFSRIGMLRERDETNAVLSLCQKLETRCNSIEQSVATLSGGNQQKVAVSKWLLRDADVFLFDEPTRGIDVAARRRIYVLLDSLAEAGKGILIVSSDLEELLETCDRIAVMSAGRLVAIFPRDQWSEEAIMRAAFSGYRSEPVVNSGGS